MFMKSGPSFCGRSCKRFSLQGLTRALAFAAGMVLGQTHVSAQTATDAYTPPVMKAPYTLTFAVRVEKPDLEQWGNMPLKAHQAGTLTLSSNGNQVLYRVRFGEWSEVIICDIPTHSEYFYDNSDSNAVIQPGVKSGLSAMSLLPLPGAGYDFYPMFQSFTYSGSGPSHATMAVISGVTGATDGVIQGMLYQDTLVEFNKGVHPPTIATSKIIVPGHPALAEEVWRFSKYRLVGTVPVAGVIDHVLNSSSVAGVWPPEAMKRDGEVWYRLLSASTTSLPRDSYDLASYLPPGCAVSDARATCGGAVSYVYNRRNGTLDEQSGAAGAVRASALSRAGRR